TSVDGDHLRDVLAAVHVGLLDRHDDPAFRPTAGRRVHGQVRDPSAQLVVLDDHGPTVDVQPDPVAEEIHHQQPDVRTFVDVAQTCHDSVAAVLGVGQVQVVEHPDEARR